MEFVITAALVLFLLYLLGLKLGAVIAIIMAAICVFVVAVAVFFLWCAARLAFSRNRRGIFCGVEKNGKFEHAIYIVDGEEYMCVFPSEKLLREKVYKADKPVRVWLLPKGRLFDTGAFVTIVAGTVFFVPSAVLWVMFFLSV